MMRVLLLVAAAFVTFIHAEEQDLHCDCGGFIEEPELAFPDHFGCREKNGTCVSAQHVYNYCTTMSFGDVCKQAQPDHEKMSKELLLGGRRFTGIANHFGILYYRDQERQLFCATIEDDSCPSSFIYTAPKGSIQFGCHERDGVLYESYIDPVKLNEFFNTMRLE